jgi:hypothetical protein
VWHHVLRTDIDDLEGAEDARRLPLAPKLVDEGHSVDGEGGPGIADERSVCVPPSKSLRGFVVTTRFRTRWNVHMDNVLGTQRCEAIPLFSADDIVRWGHDLGEFN